MITQLKLNVAPLKTVETELYSSIQQASGAFESFLAGGDREQVIGGCIDALDQVRGVLKLLELPGASLLAEEMTTMMQKIAGGLDPSDFVMSALGHGFIALPCYIEYSISEGLASSVLIAPYINEMKAANHHPLLAESTYSSFVLPEASPIAGLNLTPIDGSEESVRRLRQMFQIGLLACLKSESKGAKISLLKRAMERIYQHSADSELLELWALGAAVTEAFESGDLDITFSRKRLLARFDRYLRATEKSESVADWQELKSDLLYLIQLADSQQPLCRQICEHYGLISPSICDRDVKRLRGAMQGPNTATIASMVVAVKEELAGAKEILEVASQDAVNTTVELTPLIATIMKVADILSVVGLKSAATILRRQLVDIQRWADGEVLNDNEMLNIADALLFVESSLSNLTRLDAGDELHEMDEEAKQHMIAQTHLADAESVVINEAQAGISLAKRAISSYIESNYDPVHISNVSKTLVTVRGGLNLLNFDRACRVIDKSVEFVDQALTSDKEGADKTEMLATLADALISLEYYLDEAKAVRQADNSVLEIAEASLAQLGFPVAA